MGSEAYPVKVSSRISVGRGLARGAARALVLWPGSVPRKNYAPDAVLERALTRLVLDRNGAFSEVSRSMLDKPPHSSGVSDTSASGTGTGRAGPLAGLGDDTGQASEQSLPGKPDERLTGFEGPLGDLIETLALMPGISPRSAQRLAFQIVNTDPVDIRRLASVLVEVNDKVRFCVICGNVAEEDECKICRDPQRDVTTLCVVHEPNNIVEVERTREFHGRYHVLGGAISPIEGIGPDDLRIRELMQRLADGSITEVILATSLSLEGEATATYLAHLLRPMGLRVTRIARGLPVGGDKEYADEATLDGHR